MKAAKIILILSLIALIVVLILFALQKMEEEKEKRGPEPTSRLEQFQENLREQEQLQKEGD
ncbi:MAG: hypothetical protein K6G45_00360 [Lachnospiraceae bacterium]|nr:hypothetical protein [Lachnospiraceae bacterium]MCR5766930.1 hypothetical protein [Lachnospiraceae bacterium]